MLADVMQGGLWAGRCLLRPERRMVGRAPRVAALRKSAMTGAAHGRIKVLFQGRFDDGRGIEELISRMDAGGWRASGLVPAWTGKSSRQAAIELARRLNLLDKSVFFLDPVSEDMLVAAAAEADIGVIPYKPLIRNDRFACPNKLSQYLHAGLMVVTNDLPYVKSVVQAAGAGLIVRIPPILSSFAATSIGSSAIAELLDRCRQNALSYARQSFNWQCHAETLDALYRGMSPATVNSSSVFAVEQPASVPK